MKNLILTFLAVSLALVLSAQTTANEYMKRAPGIPETVCKTKSGIEEALIMA